MGFNDGFSTQGVPFVTGSADGQLLTWDSATQEWVPGDGLGSISSTVSTSNGIIGDGTPSNTVRLDSNITVENITVSNTASIAHLDTIYQQSLVIGDKWITILSGANTHATADNSGILWGSGSTDGTTGDQGSVAYVLYRSGSDSLNVFPGLVVSGNVSASGIFYGDGSGLVNLPTQTERVLYVASGSVGSSQNGSLTDPFVTIQSAINYASSSYTNFSQSVIVEVGPGKYAENLSITRPNTYIKSHLNKTDQRAIELNGNIVIDCPTATQKYGHVVGFEGMFVNNSNTNPTVRVSGTGSFLTYFKNCYLASANVSSSVIKLDSTRTFDNTKLTVRHTTINSQRAGSDALSIAGGDVKLDSIELFCTTTVAGTTNAISASGDTVIAADRLLVEMSSPVTGSALINNSSRKTSYPVDYASLAAFQPTVYFTNSTLSTLGSGISGSTIYTGRNTFLWNVIIGAGNRKIQGFRNPAFYADLQYITYGNITIDSTLVTSSVSSSFLKEYHGDVAGNTVTASAGFSGRLYGTSSYALDAGALGGVATSSYARRDVANTFTAQNTFDQNVFMLGSNITFQPEAPPAPNVTGDLTINRGSAGGGNFNLNGGQLNVDGGDVVITTGDLIAQSGIISGSGTGISNLSGSNWGPDNSFSTDVRNQLSSSGGVNYDKSTGVISVDDFLGVQTTGSITGSGLVGNEIKLKDAVSVISLTASAGISARLYGTASYALNADKLDTYDHDDFAKLLGGNSFTGTQAVNGTITATSITASLKGNGAQVTNLTASNWNGNTPAFYGDVVSTFEFDNSIGTSSLGGGRIKIEALVSKVGLLSTGNITGSGAPGEEFNLKPNISVTSVTATSFTGTLSGTASYANNADKLDDFHVFQLAKTGSNTFTDNQTVNGRISASSGITGSFSGNGAQITNLTGSNWNNGIPGFYLDVQDSLTPGAGVQFSTGSDKRLIIEADIDTLGLKTGNGLTGSGVTLDPFKLQDTINIVDSVIVTNDVTASNFITNGGYFIGDLVGTAHTASTLDGHTIDEFALLDTDVSFTSVTSSFNGSGAELTDLTASNFTDWYSDVSSVFVAGDKVSINPVGDNTYAISASITDLTASNWTGGTASFYQDVRTTFTAGTNIGITPDGDKFIISASLQNPDLTGSAWSGGTGSFYTDVRTAFVGTGSIVISPMTDSSGRYQISSSGGSGGLSSVLTTGSITGSGKFGEEIDLKPDIKIDTLEFTKLSSDPASHTVGQLWYNSSEHHLKYSTEFENLDINIGQQIVQKVKNESGTTLVKGTVVHISGSTYSEIPVVNVADWENEYLSTNALGVIMTDTPDGDSTYVLTQGILSGINTIGKPNGAILYLSSSGQVSIDEPEAPKHNVIIGQVIKQLDNGIIYVSVQDGYELEELHDVDTSSGKSNGDLIVWNEDNSVWNNSKNLSGSYTIDGELSASQGITASYGFYADPSIISNIRVVYADTASVTYDPGAARTTINNTFTTNSINQFNARTTFVGPITASEARFTGTEILFTNNIRVNGTASIAQLNTISQSSLQIGDKYIIIASASTEHSNLYDGGILWGSGAFGGDTVDESGAHASIRFRSGNYLEAFPGLRVSGSLVASNGLTVTGSINSDGIISGSVLSGSGDGIINLTTASFSNFSGSVWQQITGSNGILFSRTTGTASLGGTGQLTNLTASGHVSASAFIGDGSGLTNLQVTPPTTVSKDYTLSGGNPDSITAGCIVAMSGGLLFRADNSDSEKSNAIGVVTNINGSTFTIAFVGDVAVNGIAPFSSTPGTTLYVGTTGSVTNYAGIAAGRYITQIGYSSLDTSGKIILQPRVFGQKA